MQQQSVCWYKRALRSKFFQNIFLFQCSRNRVVDLTGACYRALLISGLLMIKNIKQHFFNQLFDQYKNTSILSNVQIQIIFSRKVHFVAQAAIYENAFIDLALCQQFRRAHLSVPLTHISTILHSANERETNLSSSVHNIDYLSLTRSNSRSGTAE